MKHVDMRKLAPAAQEERRRQVIGLRQSGVSYAAIAAQVGLSQTGVFNICQRFAAKGETGLVSGKRGRKPDEQRRLTTGKRCDGSALLPRSGAQGRAEFCHLTELQRHQPTEAATTGRGL